MCAEISYQNILYEASSITNKLCVVVLMQIIVNIKINLLCPELQTTFKL